MDDIGALHIGKKHHRHFHVANFAADGFDQAMAVGTDEAQIGDHQIRRFGTEPFNCGVEIAAAITRVAAHGQDAGEIGDDRRVVIDRQTP